MKSRSQRYPIPLVLLAVCIAILISWAYTARGEGGEPRYFAIKNARIVPVSGPVIASGTVVVAKGLIQAVGTNVAIPPEAWVIDGAGLTVYPGLIDAGTNLGLAQEDDAKKRAAAPGANASGPEDRPGTTPWRVAADELKTDDKRIESWRNAGFTTALTVPDGGIFPGQATVIDLAGDAPRRLRGASASHGARILQARRRIFRFPRFAHGHDRLRPPGARRHRVVHASRADLPGESHENGARPVRPHRRRAQPRAAK